MCDIFIGQVLYVGFLFIIIEVKYEYMIMNMYIVFVNGFNVYFICLVNFIYVIFDVDCLQFKVSVKDLKLVFYYLQEVKRSSMVRVVGVIDIYCIIMFDNIKKWMVYNIDENSGEDL